MTSEYEPLCRMPSLIDTIEKRVPAAWAIPSLRTKAAHMLWMSSISRDALLYPETDNDTAAMIMSRAKEQTTQKLTHVGLSLCNYFDAYNAFGAGDVPMLREIEQAARYHVVPDDNQPDTKSLATDVRGHYSPRRMRLHHDIVTNVLRNIPSSKFPVFHVLMGVYGVGKSETIRNTYANTQNMYVSDPDALRPLVMPDYDPSNHTHVQRTAREVIDLSDTALATAVHRRLSVLCETSLRHLDWWQQIIESVVRAGYRVELHMAVRPLQECFRRVFATRDRPARVGDYLDITKRYSNFAALMNHPHVSGVTLTSLPGVNNMPAENCPITGDYVRSLQTHPKLRT